MLFNSYIFVLAFLPAAVCGYFALGKLQSRTASRVFLLAMSLVFYGWLNPKYLIVLLASAAFNFLFGRLLVRDFPPKSRKLLAAAGIICNILVLLYCKYFNFFVTSFNAVFGTALHTRNILLPLGISFFTFQQLAYLIDCYRGDAPRYSALSYLSYVTFFPYVISGPIALHSEIIPQLEDEGRRRFQYENFAKGMTGFCFGLFKKVLLADAFGKIADFGFAPDAIGALSTTDAVIVMLAYTFQLYFDFSGYCDMAVGVGRMFNIELPQNFNSPYRATSIADFWKRWHMTLTRFFTRYLYIPLGGNRRGLARTCVNTMIVFLVSGLWHGANFTFILWGLLHGLALVVHRLTRDKVRLPKPAGWALTFAFVNLAWAIFRAPSLGQAWAFFGRLFSFTFTAPAADLANLLVSPEFEAVGWLFGLSGDTLGFLMLAVYFVFAFVSIWKIKNTDERIAVFQPRVRTAAACVILFLWSLVSFSGVSSFLYFTF